MVGEEVVALLLLVEMQAQVQRNLVTAAMDYLQQYLAFLQHMLAVEAAVELYKVQLLEMVVQVVEELAALLERQVEMVWQEQRIQVAVAEDVTLRLVVMAAQEL
jgi:hypothetical protein